MLREAVLARVRARPAAGAAGAARARAHRQLVQGSRPLSPRDRPRARRAARGITWCADLLRGVSNFASCKDNYIANGRERRDPGTSGLAVVVSQIRFATRAKSFRAPSRAVHVRSRADRAARRQPGALYPLTGTEAIIGRDPEAAMPLLDSSLSRQHARILRTDIAYTVEDLGSTNGTYVDGKRVEGSSRSRTAAASISARARCCISGSRQGRARGRARDVRADVARSADRRVQPPPPAGALWSRPRSRSATHAAVADPARHRSLQAHQRQARPCGGRRGAALVANALTELRARKTCSRATAARSSR